MRSDRFVDFLHDGFDRFQLGARLQAVAFLALVLDAVGIVKVSAAGLRGKARLLRCRSTILRQVSLVQFDFREQVFPLDLVAVDRCAFDQVAGVGGAATATPRRSVRPRLRVSPRSAACPERT